jgi:hypothetical protein
LAIIISGNSSVLSDMEAEDAAAPLFYTDEARDSKLLQALPTHVVDHLQDQSLAMENHGHGERWRAAPSSPTLCCHCQSL